MGKRLLAVVFALLLPVTAAGESLAVWLGGSSALLTDGGGVIVPPGVYQQITSLGGGLYAAGSRTEKGFLYGIIDGTGNQIASRAYEMLARDGDGILFRKDGLCGALAEDGSVRIENRYTELVSNGQGGYLALDTDPTDDVSDAVYYVDSAGSARDTGVRTLSGLSAFSCGRMKALSAESNLYGYLDANGAWATPDAYVTCGDFVNGAAVASRRGGTGIIDADGNWLIESRYESVQMGDPLILAGRHDGGYDVYSAENFTILYTLPRSGGGAGLCGDGIALYAEGNVTVYDGEAKSVLTLSDQAAVSAGWSGQIVASDGAWGEACERLYAADGTPLSKAYQRILYLGASGDSGLYAFLTFDATAPEAGKTQYTWDQDSVRYGLMDGGGTELLPAVYEELRLLGDGRLFAAQDDAIGMIDLSGAWLYRIIPE